MSTQQISIGKDAAIAMYESGWWKGKTAREIVAFQLFVRELCLPFDEFHKAVGNVLDRPVWTHEFGLALDQLIAEFLGNEPAPTFEQIVGLIPPEKLILIREQEKRP